MPGEGLIASGIMNGISGIISGIAGIGQKREGKKILKQIGEETIPTDIIQNQVAARRMAGEGLPAEQYANAMKNIQRQQLAALRGAHDRRSGLGIIPQITGATNDATLNLDVADANARRANELRLMQVNNQIGGWKNRIWERKYNYGQSLVGAGNQNLYGGIDKFASGAGLVGYGAYGYGGNGGRTSPNNGFTLTEADFQRD